MINGAKVFKPSQKTTVPPGRTILAVPRDIENTLVLTLTWLGADYKPSLIAEAFTQSSADSCMLGFFNPKCLGMVHLGTNDETINGETITVHPNAFLDGEGNLIADKRILLYVTNAALDGNSDLAQSSA